jgi:signal transduction histidine kinase
VTDAPPRAASHAGRVALSASLVAVVLYLLAAAVADAVVLHHFNETASARLTTRLTQLIAGRSGASNPADRASSGVGATTTAPPATGARPSGSPAEFAGTAGDLDDAPIFGWWIPASGGRAVPLSSGAPALNGPPPVGAQVTRNLSGRPFLLESGRIAGGRVVVATSIAQLAQLRFTLLVIESLLCPVMVGSCFLVALLIGRRAAAPVERARRRQLEFTADASHELRTPLSVIEAEVGLALSDERDAEGYRESLGHISEEARRLRGIVEDLLWLARADSLPSPPVPELLDLTTLARTSARRFIPIADARRIALVTDPEDAPSALVRAPAEWIDRLVSVLVDNACRYTDEGGHIAVHVQRRASLVVLSVADDGPGIESTERQSVFMRFHRASDRPGGAGLGLSIADAIVKGSDGQWTLGTSDRGGALFEATWPSAG